MKSKKEKWMVRLILLFMFICTLPVILFLLFIFCNSFLSSSEFISRYGMAEHGNQVSQYVQFSFFQKRFLWISIKMPFGIIPTSGIIFGTVQKLVFLLLLEQLWYLHWEHMPLQNYIFHVNKFYF